MEYENFYIFSFCHPNIMFIQNFITIQSNIDNMWSTGKQFKISSKRYAPFLQLKRMTISSEVGIKKAVQL